MTRNVRKTNVRVVLEPSRTFTFRISTPEETERHALREAERIVEEVRRHVDDVGSAGVHYDLETFCSTREWAVDDYGDSLGRWPECCGDDQADFYNDHKDESDDWFTKHGMTDPEYLQEFRAGHHQRAGE